MWQIYVFFPHFLALPDKKMSPSAKKRSQSIQLIAKGQIKAYPNPVKAGDIFKIGGVKELEGATVTVNSIDGTLINAFKCDSAIAEIPTGGLSSGIYLYTATRNGKVLASGKIVVE